MRLTRIEIENFKGIGKRQVIDLAPITLLFGPNSAGKSTVLQALHYVREILERQNPDADATIAGGHLDLGGFTSLVHRHELDKAIKIKLVLSLKDIEDDPNFAINAGSSIRDERFAALPLVYRAGDLPEVPTDGTVHSIGLELVVRSTENGAYVHRLEFDHNGERTMALEGGPGTGAVLGGINFGHPLFARFDLDPDEQVESDEIDHPLKSEIMELSAAVAASSHISSDEEVRLAVETRWDALPLNSGGLKPAFTEIDFRDYLPNIERSVSRDGAARALEGLTWERQRREGLEQFLNELALGPLNAMKEFLAETRYLGPLRALPPRNYEASRSNIAQISNDRWADGMAAWDTLQHPSEAPDAVDWLNECMGFVPLGYDFVHEAVIQLPAAGPIAAAFDRGVETDDFAELQEEFAKTPSRLRLRLRDVGSGVLVEPADVGVGVSQVVPVMLAADPMDICNLVAIEQPELHLHPALQVGLGDLFATSIEIQELEDEEPSSYLIETHSEHLLLRLLRRIREKSNNELPPGAPAMSPDDLSVIYVDTTTAGSTFKRLRIDDEGEFIDRWPKGFFEERAEELF